MTRLSDIQWKHPVYGRINETVCSAHEQEVLAALVALGIGCLGRPESERDACDRCFHRAQHPRDWIASRARPR